MKVTEENIHLLELKSSLRSEHLHDSNDINQLDLFDKESIVIDRGSTNQLAFAIDTLNSVDDDICVYENPSDSESLEVIATSLPRNIKIHQR